MALVDAHEQVVGIEIAANLGIGSALTQYVREGWQLERSSTARTKPWKGLRTFDCPACGAPFEASGEGRCASCGSSVRALRARSAGLKPASMRTRAAA